MTEVKELRRRRKTQRRTGAWGRVVAGWRDLLPLGATGFAALAFTLVGGAPLSVLGVMTLAISTLVLLVAIAFSPGAEKLAALPWHSRVALGVIILLPLVQLIPLPPALWQALPGQEIRHTVLATIGRGDSWQPISLTPIFTMEAMIACLALVTLIMVMLTLEERHLRHIGWLILAIVAVDVAIGTLQVASGGYPVLRESRNQGAMLGFFANKNHMGLFVAASMPLAWHLLDVRRRRSSRLYMFVGWCVLSLVALIATNSRSGLVVGMVAAAILWAPIVFRQSQRLRIMALVGVVAAVAILSLTNPFEALFGRFSGISDDLRWNFWQQSIPLAKAYWPLGSGAGSFTQVFMVNEHLSWVKPTYVNAVHNDYIQLCNEFGMPGIAALILFIISLAAIARPAFNKGVRNENTGKLIAGITILLLFALQSIVDYPLRRVATLPMFAMAIAFILRSTCDDSSDRGFIKSHRTSAGR